MNTITETRPATIAIGPAARFGAQLRVAFQRRRQRRHTRASLKHLDEHLLMDIGLRRDQVDELPIRPRLDTRHRPYW